MKPVRIKKEYENTGEVLLYGLYPQPDDPFYQQVQEIKYHQPVGEGDQHYCTVTLNNGVIRRIFRPDIVDFAPENKLIDDNTEQYLEDICYICKQKTDYCEKYDAYYCEDCNIWTTEKCKDEFCEFCSNRPTYPSARNKE